MALFFGVFSLLFALIPGPFASEVPVGHLKPLGSHRPPSTDLIDEIEGFPSPQDFWEKWVKPSRALVLRGAAKHSEAFTKWTDEYLKENYGDLEVRLEGKKEKSGRIPSGAMGVGRDTIGNFVDNAHKPGAKSYIVSDMPSPMYKDFAVIPPLTCGTFKDYLVEVDLWLSGGGTASIMHKDAFNAINCLMNGTKVWKMIEYKYEDKIYKAWEPPEMIGGFSKINVQNVDLLKYPKVAEVPWSLVTINAGDCLFLPKSYYHQVTSSGDTNAAVALLFSRFDHMDNLDFSDCNRELKPTPLSEMDIDWKYSGHGNLTMGNTDVGIVKHSMTLLFEGKDRLDKKSLMAMEHKPLTTEQKAKKQYYIGYCRPHVEKIWEMLDGDKHGFITLQQVQNLTRDQMRKFIIAAEGTDITNLPEHEYGHVDLNELIETIKGILKAEKQMKKDTFVRRYMDSPLFGSELFANKLFKVLDSDGDDVMTREEFKSNKKKALEPYFVWSDYAGDRRDQVEDAPDVDLSNDAYLDPRQEEEEEDPEVNGGEPGENEAEPEGETEEAEEREEESTEEGHPGSTHEEL